MSIEKITSYLIHPIIFGVIATITYFILLPVYLPRELKFNIIGIVFISTYIIPVIFLFLLKKFNSIDSFHLSSIKERKYPLSFFITLNLLLWQRLQFLPKMEMLSLFFLASSIALFVVYIALFFNVKVSLHTLALGLFTTFLGLLSYYFKIRLILLISFLVLVSGFVAYVRLKLEAHNTFEVYFGFILGVIVEILLFYYFV